jgi:hypothetical protein
LELVPVDAHVDEAEHIAHEDGPERQQDAEVRTVRDFEFQHMMVMTPSLKTSSLFFPMQSPHIGSATLHRWWRRKPSMKEPVGQKEDNDWHADCQ